MTAARFGNHEVVPLLAAGPGGWVWVKRDGVCVGCLLVERLKSKPIPVSGPERAPQIHQFSARKRSKCNFGSLLCIHKELAAFVPLCRSLKEVIASDDRLGILQFSIFSRRFTEWIKGSEVQPTLPTLPTTTPCPPKPNFTTPANNGVGLTTSDLGGFYVMQGPSDLLRQNFFGGRALHVASISENPEVTRCGVGVPRFRPSAGKLVRRFTKNWCCLFGDFLKHQHLGPHQPAVDFF